MECKHSPRILRGVCLWHDMFTLIPPKAGYSNIFSKMSKEESLVKYRYWGIEIRIFYIFVAIVIFLIFLISFKTYFSLSIIFLVISLVLTLAIFLDYRNHFLSTDPKGLSLKKILLFQVTSQIKVFPWEEIRFITTTEYGIFHLLKKTEITSQKGDSIKIFSFMDDYLHFLKEVTSKSQFAEIDKLTTDLLAGRAEL